MRIHAERTDNQHWRLQLKPFKIFKYGTFQDYECKPVLRFWLWGFVGSLLFWLYDLIATLLDSTAPWGIRFVCIVNILLYWYMAGLIGYISGKFL